jgi:hypothetical protein
MVWPFNGKIMGGRVMNWDKFAECLQDVLAEINENSQKPGESGFRYGQEEAVNALKKCLSQYNGAILADEVGLGKTRVALILMEAVLRAGGTVAAVVPRGLMFQWENEAKELAKTLKNPYIDKQIHKLANYDDLFNNGDKYPFSRAASESRWALISHNFRMFSGHVEKPRRYAFWSQIAYNLRSREKKSWKSWLNEVFGMPQNKKRSKVVKRKEKEALAYKKQIKTAVNYLKSKGLVSKQKLSVFKNLDNIEPRYKKVKLENVKNAIFKDKEGLISAQKLIGCLIGNIDFLVIDEAHKSKVSLKKNANQSDQSILETLLNNIIQRSKEIKTLCMTATPIEMDADNWLQLLKRCGISYSEYEKECIRNFDEKLEEANLNPDNRSVLENLIVASGEYEKKLKEYVVRRRRCNQQEHRDLLKGIKCEGFAHPYREKKLIPIDRSKLTANWQKAILCYDGAYWAARGLSQGASQVSDAAKRLQRQLATGGYDYEPDSREIEEIEDVKQKRLAFWLKKANKYAKKDSEDGRSYPRIQETATFIEKLLNDNKEEKVLVFGTFTDPMRDLRDELNYRYIARRIKDGQILKHQLSETTLEKVFAVYKHLFEENMCLIDFKKEAVTLHGKYITLQGKINDILKNEEEKIIDQLIQKKKKLHRERDLFKEIKDDKELSNSLFKSVKEDLLNSFVDRDDSIDEKRLNLKIDDVREKFQEHILAFIRDVSDSGESTGISDEEEKIKDSIKSLKDHLAKLSDDKEGSRSSAYCRLMDGDTDWNTRRRIQRQFNTENSSPRVLIAQSKVGREGLNLHTCCRKIVLFHQEWNPGVVEQQIGRVDRIDSLWNKMAKKWQEEKKGDFPKIEIYYVVFSGTYDQHQYEVLESRSIKMNAQLFGALLSEKAIEKVPEEMKKTLIEAAPNFDPVLTRKKD